MCSIHFMAAVMLSASTGAASGAPHEAMAISEGDRMIECEVTVGASRSEVWTALTTTEGVTTFFAPNANVELRYGGPYEILFDAEAKEGLRGSEGCKVVSYVHEQMLSFTWNAPPTMPEMRSKRTFVVMQLSDAENGRTTVRLTNGGYQSGEKWDESYDYFQEAWPYVLGNLKKRFEDGPLWSESDRMTLAPPAARSHYVYLLHPAREGFMESPTEAEQAKVAEHAAYLRGLVGANCVWLAGPSFPPTQFPSGGDAIALNIPAPGIVIFTAASDEAALAIMQNDPAVRAGVFKACLNQFHWSFASP